MSTAVPRPRAERSKWAWFRQARWEGAAVVPVPSEDVSSVGLAATAASGANG